MHRILLLDDDKEALVPLTYFFQPDDLFIVDVFTSAKAALGQFTHHHYDLIISDYDMMEMNGIEFLRRAQRMQTDAVRILMSGHEEIELLEHAINDVHVFSFIKKPWEVNEVQEVIRDALAESEKLMDSRRLCQLLQQQREIIRYQSQILSQLELHQPGMTERCLIDAVFG